LDSARVSDMPGQCLRWVAVILKKWEPKGLQ
jgi:hypothetical protein